MSSRKPNDRTRMPVIECLCGTKILLIPNTKEMSKAIETHIHKHIKKLNLQKDESELEAERIRNDLITQLLNKACQK